MSRRFLAASFAAALCIASAGALAQSAAEIVSIEGKGEFRAEGQSAWSPARVKQPVPGGTYLRTLDLSRMAILFADKTQHQLAPNSTMQVKAIGGAGQPTVLNLNRGKSWTQSKTTPRGLVMETPSALAAIRGTDWEMTVDDEGRATLAVFSGEVELYNDQGSVLVGASEQARAEKGRAPVKLTLQVSRDRIQWVSAFTIDRARHPDEDLPQAYARLQSKADRTAAEELLLGDIEIYRGELAAARQAFERGVRRHPADERFAVALARASLLAGEVSEARKHAQAALLRKPDSVEALVALGEIERRDGRAEPALAAYGRAVALASKDPRGWHGVGVVEGERENVRRARSSLEAAIALEPREADYLGELGTLEGMAGNLDRGREALNRALALQPDNYVALTGLGVLELKAGRIEAALDALLKATLLEPRYARAHLYLAATYYQMRRDAAALEALARASEMDPKDPLPHLLASMVHMDRIEPVAATEAARRALDRMPFLKSLNQVADNQKGVANVGFPLAFMGLESWARSAAHDAYLPFWGSSHFFLADRYPGDFNKRSELSQGFLTNPLAFGASNRFQTLFPEPGHHGTVGLNFASTDDLRVVEPVVTLNGYDARRIPFAYFVEAIHTRIDPRNTDLRVKGPTYTMALGAKPTHELGVFLYANRLEVEADIGRPGATGVFDTISGSGSRVEGGARYAFSASNSLWWKAGAGRQNSRLEETTSLVAPEVTLSQSLRFALQPRTSDTALRQTVAFTPRMEATWGAEAARARNPRQLQRDATFRVDGGAVAQEALEQTDHDRSEALYALGRLGDERLHLEAGLTAARYRVKRDIEVTRSGEVTRVHELLERERVDPLLGLVWRAAPALTARFACRRWLRPASLDTLMPVAVAAMPLDDQLVFAGGRLQQCRGQAEWTASRTTFVSAHVERSRVRNLVSPLDGVLNTQSDITNLERLRNRAVSQVPKPDLLEETPVFGEGVARRANLAVEHIAGRGIGLRAHYTYTDSENTAPGHADRRIPYLARHQANLGLTWSPGWRSHVTLGAVYRTHRFADEANTVRLPSGWDAQASLYIETPDKRWAVEISALNLLKKEASDVFGVLLSHRF